MHFVQVNGKMRGTVEVNNNVSQAEAQAAAVSNANIAKFVDGKSVRKVIWVPGKMLNLIVGK